MRIDDLQANFEVLTRDVEDWRIRAISRWLASDRSLLQVNGLRAIARCVVLRQQLHASCLHGLMEALEDDGAEYRIPGVPVAIARLSPLGDRERVRTAAARGLGELGVCNSDVVQALLKKAISAGDSTTDVFAVKALKTLQPAPAVLTDAIQKTICDRGDSETRERMAMVLKGFEAIGDDVMTLLLDWAACDDEDSVRWHSTAALRDMGCLPAKAIDVLMDRLTSDPSAQVRSCAAEALGNHGKGLTRVSDCLLDGLRHEETTSVRDACALALGRLEVEVELALDIVFPELDGASSNGGSPRDLPQHLRRVDLKKFAEASAAAREAVFGVLATRRSPRDRKKILDIMVQTKSPRETLVSALVDRFESDEDETVRVAAAIHLAALGTMDPEIADMLLRAIKAEVEPRPFISMARSLLRAQQAEAWMVSRILEHLADPASLAQIDAAKALCDVPSPSAEVFEQLIERVITDEDDWVAAECVASLRTLGTDRNIVNDALIRRFRRTQSGDSVMFALGQLESSKLDSEHARRLSAMALDGLAKALRWAEGGAYAAQLMTMFPALEEALVEAIAPLELSLPTSMAQDLVQGMLWKIDETSLATFRGTIEGNARKLNWIPDLNWEE